MKINNLNLLIQKLNNVFSHLKNNSKLKNINRDTNSMIYDYLKNYYKNYNKSEINYYCNINILESNKYYRRKLYQNEDYEMILINWGSNVVSNIHDHPENGCHLLVLNGTIVEYLYNKELYPIQYCLYNKGDISYIDNHLGYHKIITKNYNKINSYSYINSIITLHIYSPTNYKPNFYYTSKKMINEPICFNELDNNDESENDDESENEDESENGDELENNDESENEN